MKKIVFLGLFVMLGLAGCSKKVYDSHTSETSIDYKGVYRGILPCADCKGIETVVTLSEGAKYELSRKYQGKDGKEFKSTGTFSWEKDGQTIALKNEKAGPNKYLVGENTLTALDNNGQKVTGVSAQKYVLRKDNASTDTEVPVAVLDAPFAGQRFTLREINGSSIVQGERNAMMQFEKSGKFSAYAGCNNMSGKYVATKSDISVKFSQVAATRMACPDMNTEQQFMKALEMITQYSFDGEQLLFMSNEKTVLRLEKQ